MQNKIILSDLHNTVFNKAEKPIGHMVEVLRCLSKEYGIIFITARLFKNQAELNDQIAKIDNLKIPYLKFLCMPVGYTEDDDVKNKIELVKNNIYPEQILLALDNSRKVTKAYKKMGINILKKIKK